MIDPYITRHPFSRTVFGKLKPNEELIKKEIPVANDVLVGHSHFDHVLDAPVLCSQTGARLIGSQSTCNVGRAYGLPEHQLVSTQGGDLIESGPFDVLGVKAQHGKILGRIPYPGNIDCVPRWPPKSSDLRHGQVLNWHIHTDGLSIMHIDSADYYEDELKGINVDILCLCAVGWQARPKYLESIIDTLKPSVIIPCHWDYMYTPYSTPPRLIPGVNLNKFVEIIRELGVKAVVLPFNGVYHINS